MRTEEHVQAFLDSVARTFTIGGPIYQYAYDVSSPPREAHFLARRVAAQCDTMLQIAAIQPIDSTPDLCWVPASGAVAQTVICRDTLQLLTSPHQAVQEIHRLMRPGGILLYHVTIDTDGEDVDSWCWRPTPHAIATLLSGFDAMVMGWHQPDRHTDVLFGLACAAPLAPSFLDAAQQFQEVFPVQLRRRGGLRRLWTALCSAMRYGRASAATMPLWNPRFYVQFSSGLQAALVEPTPVAAGAGCHRLDLPS